MNPIRMPMPTPLKICSGCLRRSRGWRIRDGIASPRIAVIAADPWPLPWYLRQFSQVGFWQPGQQTGLADFYITSTEAGDQYADQLQDFRPEFFGVRPGVLILLWSPAPK